MAKKINTYADLSIEELNKALQEKKRDFVQYEISKIFTAIRPSNVY